MIEVIGEFILVEPIVENETKTEAGLFISRTQAAYEKLPTGMVIGRGHGRETQDGTLVPFRVEIGQKILYSHMGYTEYKENGKTYHILTEKSILAVLND